MYQFLVYSRCLLTNKSHREIQLISSHYPGQTTSRIIKYNFFIFTFPIVPTITAESPSLKLVDGEWRHAAAELASASRHHLQLVMYLQYTILHCLDTNGHFFVFRILAYICEYYLWRISDDFFYSFLALE